MSDSPLVCVLTTIQQPTRCVRLLGDVLQHYPIPLLVVGDRKGPADFALAGARFWNRDQQEQLDFRLARVLPDNHYARKNLAYLLAMQRGAPCLYETDDDNHPAADWRPRSLETRAAPVAPREWLNVYRLFTDSAIWPRGFPLERLRDPQTIVTDLPEPACSVRAPIQQGLANLAPDVDAVWRLVMDREFHFRQGPSVRLAPGTWCPFNSQSTWWWPEAYPLLYLPSYCSFRMTDIWRGFVAQRCLWEMGHSLVFHAPEVIQERNQHNLLRDFGDEVSGYLLNGKLTAALAELRLEPGPAAAGGNLFACYERLVQIGVVPATEMPLLHAWLADIEQLLKS